MCINCYTEMNNDRIIDQVNNSIKNMVYYLNK